MENDTEIVPGNRTVEKWNQELAAELLVDTIFLGIYLLVGLVGNSLVLYVYAKRKRLNNEDRFFIPILAIIDLIACIVNCSFSMSINILPVKFDSDIACKFMWFLAMSSTGTSAMTLMLIAIHRYLKLCRPFGRQMTHKWKKILQLIVWSAMITVSFPCFAFYGSASVKSSDDQLTGLRCTSVTAGQPQIALVYKAILFLIILGVLVVLIVLYSLIGRVLLRQAKFTWKLNITKEATSATSATTDSETLENDVDRHETTTDSKVRDEVMMTATGPGTLESPGARATMPDTRLQKHRSPGYRVTVMFMVIAAVFVICFIPKLTLMIWESRKTDFWLTLSPSELGGFRFLYTFFIVNNIINPFIYAFLDKKFQVEFKKLCCRRA